MRKSLLKFVLVATAILGAIFCDLKTPAVFAEDEPEIDQASLEAATSISISPVSKILQLEPNMVYEDVLSVTNNGNADLDFEVYVSPYSYVKDTSDETFKLGFNQETTYTQITRWIDFKDSSGNYTTKPKFTAAPGKTVDVTYRVSVPASIPSGGQYAVLFAHTLSSGNSSGIKTEASPGMIIYGHGVGETISASVVSDMQIRQTLENGESASNKINASAKVKNDGNIDFMATGTLKVEGVFGQSYYETPANKARISIIPETELSVSDVWEETPAFGLFKVTWTVNSVGEPQTITSMIFIFPPFMIVIVLLLLTIITIWIIIIVRKRKERRSRFTV
ncbi:hypothetical protein IKD57_01000 [Candidatus Saccharibacteria bacterium]|nr:hypothetical protein [Candidatus Saccharibacteria bacterium]